MRNTIIDIVEGTILTTCDTKIEVIKQLFESNFPMTTMIITSDLQPVGIISRKQLDKHFRSMHEYNLFMGEPVSSFMQKNFLSFEMSRPLEDLVIKAMNRPTEEMYDDIVITNQQTILGIASIRSLLLTVVPY
ncbi:hypothetical protein ACFOZ1_00395 [Gracilibacillus marinus]|uniref:CBS domain-containing protein n=1 Tax=Gracilibacillus marinus TaxID=630535 RepID=A0ABV8VRC9_9BACI